MNVEQHATILAAYIGRLSLADLRSILAAQQQVMVAAMNGNAGEQQGARGDAEAAILAAVAGMIQHDRDNIRTIIAKVMA